MTCLSLPRGPRPLAASALVALLVLVASPARAADVEVGVAAGATTYGSTWRGDAGAGGMLRLGSRFGHIIALDIGIWESYAAVNHRVNTGLSFGVTGYIPLRVVHPYARLFAMHQHEEGLVSVTNNAGGVFFGIGPGIRHRAAGGLSLGAEVPFHDSANKRLSWVFLANATAMWFPDASLGPSAYFGLDVGVGFDFLLK